MRDALDAIEKLKAENADLRAQLTKARGGKPTDDVGSAISEALQKGRRTQSAGHLVGAMTKAHAERKALESMSGPERADELAKRLRKSRS